MKSRDVAEPGMRSEVGAVFGLRVQPLATSGLSLAPWSALAGLMPKRFFVF